MIDSSRKLVMRGRILYKYPYFYHDFSWTDAAFNSWNPLLHEYRGSFIRHKTIEKVLLFLRQKVLGDLIGDACPMYDLLDSFLDIAFGFNCNFPQRNIALYVVWRLRGLKGEPIASGEKAIESERLRCPLHRWKTN